MSYADILYEVSDHVATLTLNRPDRMNAISGPMLESFSRALRDAARSLGKALGRAVLGLPEPADG